jgi:META domain
MARILKLLLLLFWKAAVHGVLTAAGAKFDGTYQLQSFVDETGSDTPIPATTRLVLASIGSQSQRYRVSVALKKGQARGNYLSGTARIRPATGGATMSPIVSTRMYTPFLEYEGQLVVALQATTNTTLSSDGVLLMKGAAMGSMRFRKVASSSGA